MCAWGDCHGYALTKQMALLPAGHLNSHRNVGIDQAGCRGSRRWAWALEQGPGCPLLQLWVREADAGTVDRGSVCPDTCCFWGQVRAGPACVRMRGRQLSVPSVCLSVSVCGRESMCVCMVNVGASECQWACACVSACVRVCTLCVCTHREVDWQKTGSGCSSTRSKITRPHVAALIHVRSLSLCVFFCL